MANSTRAEMRLWLIILILTIHHFWLSKTSNAKPEPQKLVYMAQRKYFLSQEKFLFAKQPVVHLAPLNYGTLKLNGSAIATKNIASIVTFLFNLMVMTDVRSVIFNDFYFTDEIVKIFTVFDSKLKHTVTNLVFKRCYFPTTFTISSQVKLQKVKSCSFIYCVANENTFKEIFKMLTYNVKSLTMRSIGDHKGLVMSSTSDIENCISFQGKRYRMKISALDLSSSFPNLETLELSDCSLNFEEVELTKMTHLTFLNLTSSMFVTCAWSQYLYHLEFIDAPGKYHYDASFLETFPPNLKKLAVSRACFSQESLVTGTVFSGNVTIETSYPYKYEHFSQYPDSLQIFNWFSFDFSVPDISIDPILKYSEGNGKSFNNVSNIDFKMRFTQNNITKTLQLIKLFSNVKSLTMEFVSLSAAIPDLDRLFSDLNLASVKRLKFTFRQISESESFTYFIVEMLKRCINLNSLEFSYYQLNIFIVTINELIANTEILSKLKTFSVAYNSGDDIDLIRDLFYVDRFCIETLSIKVTKIAKISTTSSDLFPFSNFKAKNLELDMINVRDMSLDFIVSFFAKFPVITNLNYYRIPSHYYPILSLNHLNSLKSIRIDSTFHVESFLQMLKLFPSNLEYLKGICFKEDSVNLANEFYKIFPFSCLRLAIMAEI